MRILFLSPFLPHHAVGHGGGRVVYELMQELAGRHEVGLATFVSADEERDLVSEVRAEFVEVHAIEHDLGHISKGRRLANLPSLTPSMLLHVHHPRMAEVIHKASASGAWDVVHFAWPFAAHYLASLSGRTAPVMELIECFGRHRRGRVPNEPWRPSLPYFLWDWWRYERYERRVLAQFARVYVLTDEDRDWLLDHAPGAPVRTRRIGIPRVPEGRTTASVQRDRVLFVGSFRHPANVEGLAWFVTEVWPLVRASRPEAVLSVVGAPAPEDYASTAGVEVLGFVPELAPHYHSASLCISPIRFGGGVKTKGLEAMAYGAPLVTTPLGAEGYAAENGEAIAIAEGADAFAARVVELLDDPEKAERIGRTGRSLVRERHHWPALLDELDADYADLIERWRSRPDR